MATFFLSICKNYTYNETEVALIKPSLILNIILQNTQTLQLFTINIKTEIIYKSYKKSSAARLGLRVLKIYSLEEVESRT
jgi:hypothetical protein